MLKKLIIILFIIANICRPQFSDVEITLDMRSIKKNNHFIINDFKDEVDRYIETTIFSQNDIDLEIPLNIHIVIESISEKGAFKTLSAQFFINSWDLKVFSRGATIPYYKGKSMSLTSNFEPTSSIFNYFAYIFLANELDGWSPLGGSEFFNEAEKIALNGKESDYSNGWDSRLKKCKKLMENEHLRKFRYHWYEINDAIINNAEVDIESEDIIDINKLLISLENDIYYLQEFYPNDRNAFLFLDIYANEIGELLGHMKMYDALILLSNYDVDNSSIYNSFIK